MAHKSNFKVRVARVKLWLLQKWYSPKYCYSYDAHVTIYYTSKVKDIKVVGTSIFAFYGYYRITPELAFNEIHVSRAIREAELNFINPNRKRK